MILGNISLLIMCHELAASPSRQAKPNLVLLLHLSDEEEMIPETSSLPFPLPLLKALIRSVVFLIEYR